MDGNGYTPSEDDLLEKLKKQMSDNNPWPERFAKLARAIARAKGSQPPVEREPGCTDVRPLVELYVSDEMEGRDVRCEHPLIWQHLQDCLGCREEYELLYDVLTREKRGQLAVPEMPASWHLPFQQTRERGSPWTVDLARGKQFFRLTFALASWYIEGLLSPNRLAVARERDVESYPEEFTLLSDLLEVDGDKLAVDAVAMRNPDQSGTYRVRVSIACTGDLPDNLSVIITWDGERWEAPVDERGQACFDAIPLAEWASTQTTGVQVRIQIRQTPDSPDGD
jgi:hypothetical protein